MTQELIVADHAYMPVMSIQQAVQRFNTLVEFVQTAMRPNIDYGVIPGTPKPTLLKPGAEKLTTLFGLTTRFQIVEKTEDWIGVAHGEEPFFYYWYRCQLWRGERLIAEADGSCNSREAKYRWRTADRRCPTCQAAAIKRSKYPPRGAPKGTEPGWYCFAKAGGCGAEFAADDTAIISQQGGRMPNPDIADQVNTLQKMAQKRALIAAVLIGVNASEFFTQDIEDMQPIGNGATYEPETTVIDIRTGEITDAQPRTIKPPAPTKRPITREQLIERFRKTQADAKAVGLDFSEHDPVHMSDSDMIRIGTQIKEAIEIERSVTKEPA